MWVYVLTSKIWTWLDNLPMEREFYFFHIAGAILWVTFKRNVTHIFEKIFFEEVKLILGS